MRLQSPRDLMAGLLVIGLGGLALYFGRGLRTGTAGEMGPGYLPGAMSWCLLGLGALILARAFALSGAAVAWPRARVSTVILAAPFLFAALLERTGLILTIAAVVILTRLALPRKRWLDLETAIFAAILAGGCALIFVVLLGQQMALLPP